MNEEKKKWEDSIRYNNFNEAQEKIIRNCEAKDPYVYSYLVEIANQRAYRTFKVVALVYIYMIKELKHNKR